MSSGSAASRSANSAGANSLGPNSQWIQSRPFDTACILAPTIIPALLVLLFPSWFSAHSQVSLGAWVALVLLVDVSHVYSTLFRTYLDKEEFEKRRSLYIMVPVMAWVAGCVLYSTGDLVFWRVLAYVAVYHFIRQQYGFMSIYLTKEGRTDRAWLDRICIYLATIYPVVFWHTHQRDFSWFVQNDFYAVSAPWLSLVCGVVYTICLALYAVQEAVRLKRKERVSVPKNVLLLGTALSWYVGIVLFNGDLVFTLTNVIAHGIPYIALIWIYERKKTLRIADRTVSGIARLFQPKYVWMYLTALILLSYIEEAFWDVLVWRERPEIFGLFQQAVHVPPEPLLAVIVPLLAVPQITHYILDGFIWRIRKPDSDLKELKLA